MLHADQMEVHVIYVFKLKFTSENKTLNCKFIIKQKIPLKKAGFRII